MPSWPPSPDRHCRESVGLDESRLGPAAWQDLAGQLAGLEVVPAAAHLAEARRVKSPYEIECLDRALRIAEEALDVVIQALERGMTERDAAMIYAVRSSSAGLRRCAPSSPWETGRGSRRHGRRIARCGRATSCASTWARRTEATAEAWRAQRCSGSRHRSVERAYLALQAGLEAASDAARGASADHIVETAARAVEAEGLPRDAWRLRVMASVSPPSSGPTLAADGVAIVEAGEVVCVEAPYYDIGSMGLAVRSTLSDHELGGPRDEPIAPRPRRPGLIGMRVAISLRLANEDWPVASAYVVEAERLGVDGAWSAEAWGQDAVSPLAFLAARTTRILLGTGIMQIGARMPAMMAMTAMTSPSISGDRFLLGLGASGPPGDRGPPRRPFERPLQRLRETVEIVRRASAASGSSTTAVTSCRCPAARARRSARGAAAARDPDLPGDARPAQARGHRRDRRRLARHLVHSRARRRLPSAHRGRRRRAGRASPTSICTRAAPSASATISSAGRAPQARPRVHPGRDGLARAQLLQRRLPPRGLRGRRDRGAAPLARRQA